MKKKQIIGMVAMVAVVVGACVVLKETGIWKKEKKEEQKPAITFDIPEEQKNAFIAEYSEEDYQVGYGWAQKVLTQTRWPLNPESIEPLKESYSVEEVSIKSSYDGHSIPADYILADGKKDCDTMIVVHGLSCNRRTNMGIEEAFLGWGYNVLSFDLAGAGENECQLSTYGAFEQYELLDCINYVKKNMSKDKKVVVYGYSYGGGVTAVALGNEEIDKKVDIAILDAPIANFKMQLLNGYGNLYSYTEYENMFRCFDNFCEMMYGFNSSDISGKERIASTTTPVLVFTSEADTVVPTSQPESIYDAVPHDKKYIHVFEKVQHTCEFGSPEEEIFLQTIKDFLDGKLY
ncbi:alpha/beta hydrolase [Anaerosporobacter faecicola]|uniref:alpha/beta hydrolase n=1 Tax=Anaerosporobacter faecicola TaxID=2718714 RepID=UPI00143AD272|nr:alpha/beta fold hydrolase [Anaerosporobacter faecicola]